MMASLVSFFDRDGAIYDLDQFKNSFSNNSFDGITIDSKGVIRFGVMTANRFGSDLGLLEIESFINEENSVLKLKVHKSTNEKAKDQEKYFSKNKVDSEFNTKSFLRGVIREYGSDELKDRCLTMLEADLKENDGKNQNEFTSIRFTEDNGGLVEKDNEFVIDLMGGVGKANKSYEK